MSDVREHANGVFCNAGGLTWGVPFWYAPQLIAIQAVHAPCIEKH